MIKTSMRLVAGALTSLHPLKGTQCVFWPLALTIQPLNCHFLPLAKSNTEAEVQD